MDDIKIAIDEFVIAVKKAIKFDLWYDDLMSEASAIILVFIFYMTFILAILAIDKLYN